MVLKNSQKFSTILKNPPVLFLLAFLLFHSNAQGAKRGPRAEVDPEDAQQLTPLMEAVLRGDEAGWNEEDQPGEQRYDL